METNNILLSNVLDTDSYKLSHWVQYPPNTTKMFSYLESRGGKYNKTVFFGLQYYLKKYLSQPVTREQVEEAAAFAKLHGEPFNYEGWMHIVNSHAGRLPVRIRAVKEGTVVPIQNVLMSVESTDPKCFWLVSWLETMLVRLWYPITVATQSWHIKKDIEGYLQASHDNADGLLFKLHDFGSRGVSSQESAMIGGAAHLVNFMGSDTIAGIYMANKYYNHEMAGFSIPASEHSTMTMWGKANEALAYANMLEQYKDQPIFACVSDSYDIYNAAENLWGGELRDKVKEYNGTLVVRPDSGDPPTVVVNLLNILWRQFGATINGKGYKVLADGVRVIQGDGINQQSIRNILDAVLKSGFSAENVNFGMGGALLQQLDRDTQKFAFKCSWAEVDGRGVDVFKQPATDGVKKSKKGRLELIETETGLRTVTREQLSGTKKYSLLETVFLNGDIIREQSLEEIRTLANE